MLEKAGLRKGGTLRQNRLLLNTYEDVDVYGILKTDIGAFDANMTPAEGAQNIYDWVIDSNEDVSGKFIEPGVGELKW